MEMAVIREALEGMLAPNLVGAVVFEALEPYGGDLPSGDKLAEFVHQRLCCVLARRLGDEMAKDVTERIGSVLGRPTPDPGRMSRDELPTAEVSMTSGAVMVAVVAATHAMDRRLIAALGGLASPLGVRKLEQLPLIVAQMSPHIVLIDATDPLPVAPRFVAAQLAHMSDDAVVVVWASAESWAQSLVEALGKVDSMRLTWLDRDDGVDPLLDLIRSRQSRG